MAATISTTDLLARLAERGQKAVESVKGKGFDFGNPSLPAGIKNGIAELREMKVDVYKTGDLEGKPYWQARGAVLFPKVFNGFGIDGLPTMIQEELCDTPKKKGENARTTFDAHVAWVRNQLGILLDNPEDIDKIPFKGWASLMKRLVDARPRITFRFETWSPDVTNLEERDDGKWYAVQGSKVRGGPYDNEEDAKRYNPYAGKDPMVYHRWQGKCIYKESTINDEMKDSSTTISVPQLPYKNGQQAEQNATQSAPDDGIPFDSTEGDTSSQETVIEKTPAEMFPNSPTIAQNDTFSEMDDIDTLVAGAKAEDVTAKRKLAALLQANGVTGEEIKKADTWDDAVELMNTRIKEKQATSVPSPKAKAKEPAQNSDLKAKSPFVPKVGGTCKFQQKDGESPIACEVVAINEQKKLAGLKDLATDALYKGVPWNRLS